MLTTILVAVLLFFLLFPVLRYVLFLAFSFHSGYLRYIRKQLGGLARPLMRGWLTALAADGLVIPLYGLGLIPPRQGGKDGIPVVLVHGLYHNRSAWAVMKFRLRRAGLRNVHTYQYNSFTSTFEPAVAGLARKLDRLPDGPFILVGHSLGGLVCRAVASDPRYRDRVAGLVTLGSPHGGSDMARLGGNRMARDLIPGRHITRRMETAVDPDCPRLALYNLVDDYVFPLDKLQPGRSGWREEVCPPMGHVWMLFSRDVADRILKFLLPLARR
jgi:pimeloyl-ACP methyl ester carboxylesterase